MNIALSVSITILFNVLFLGQQEDRTYQMNIINPYYPNIKRDKSSNERAKKKIRPYQIYCHL